MIADTSFIIDLCKEDSEAYQKLKELRKRNEPLAITVITQYEIWRGSGKLSRQESKLMDSLVDRSMIISIEPENARAAGIINNDLRKKGFQISSRDSLIAGIVVGVGDVLLTRNIKDFSKIDGIRLETY